MPVPRRRRELRMELRREEPRVVRKLDHLDEPVDGESGEDEARLLEALEVTVVELVAVPVTLVDHVAAVDRPHEAAFLERAALCAEAHRAAEIGVGAPLHCPPALVLPLG